MKYWSRRKYDRGDGLVEPSQAQKAARSYLLLFLDLMNLKVQVQLTNKKPTEWWRWWNKNKI
jgi:hypothetical protein